MPDDPVSHVKNKGEHFEISDIISPTDLPGKTFGKDYILLAHNPHGEGAGDNIHSKGLKSLEKQASEDVLKRFEYRSQQRHFGNRVIEINEVATRVGDTHSPNNPIGGHKAPLARNLRRSRLTLAAYPMIRSHSSKKQSKFCGDRGH